MSLHFVVLSFDRYSRDDVIGEVHCPFSSLDLNQIESQQVALSKEIQPRSLKVSVGGGQMNGMRVGGLLLPESDIKI